MPFADNSLKTATSWDPDFRKALGFPSDPECNPEKNLAVFFLVSAAVSSLKFSSQFVHDS